MTAAAFVRLYYAVRGRLVVVRSVVFGAKTSGKRADAAAGLLLFPRSPNQGIILDVCRRGQTCVSHRLEGESRGRRSRSG